MLECHELSRARLPVEVKYAVNSSIIDLLKCYCKLKKRYNGSLWESQMRSFVCYLRCIVQSVVVVSCRVASRRVASRRVASRRVASRRVASRRVASRRVASCRQMTLAVHKCLICVLCLIGDLVEIVSTVPDLINKIST